METITGASKRPFYEFLLEPLLMRRRIAAADPPAPLQFNDPETIRDFLGEQNQSLYPDTIYLSDSDSDEEQDAEFLSAADSDEDSIRPHFDGVLRSVTEEADLLETTHGYSSGQSSEFLPESVSRGPLASKALFFRCLRAQYSSDFTDVTEGPASECDDSGDYAVTFTGRSDDEPPEAEEIAEGEGDNFVLVDLITA